MTITSRRWQTGKLISESPSRSRRRDAERSQAAEARAAEAKAQAWHERQGAFRKPLRTMTTLSASRACRLRRTSSIRCSIATQGRSLRITWLKTRKRSSVSTPYLRWQRRGNSDGSRHRYRLRPRHEKSRPAKRLRRLRQHDRAPLRRSIWPLQTWTNTSQHVANKVRHSGGDNPHHHGAIKNEQYTADQQHSGQRNPGRH
jgi:hypothetical protein